MNKTAILSYIIDEVTLKARNVSTNMRKRIHYILKYKKITVKKYDERTLILNGWVRIRKGSEVISKLEEMKKGVSNYMLETQEQFDKMMTLNNEIRCCYFLKFKPTAPIEVESIGFLEIDQDNHDIYSKCSFNTIEHLRLSDLSTDQIKFILTRCKRVYELEVSYSSLEKLDLTEFRIKQFCFWHASFKEPVYLPKEIEKLTLIDCKSLNLIKAQKVNKIQLRSDKRDLKEYKELIKTLKGVKVGEIDCYQEQCFPSTIRIIDGEFDNEDNLEGVLNQFPDLIVATPRFPIQPTDKSKVRMIWPKLEETEEKFNLRPRKIRIDSDNAIQLNNHPELFEKVEWVFIDSKEFNFDVLPSEIRKIQIRYRVDLESVTLNRLEKEWK